MSKTDANESENVFAKKARTVQEMRDQLAQAVVDLKGDSAELNRTQTTVNAAGKFAKLCEVEVHAQVMQAKHGKDAIKTPFLDDVADV